MAVRRRARGALEDAIQVGYIIEQKTKRDVRSVAEKLGISDSEMAEALLRHALDNDLNDQGIPSWMPELDRSGELPIDAP